MKPILVTLVSVFLLAGCGSHSNLCNPSKTVDQGRQDLYDCEMLAYTRATPREKGNPFIIEMYKANCMELKGWRPCE